MKNIVLFGGGLHSSYCIDTIQKENKYRIIGIIDSVKEVGSILYDYKIIGRQEQLPDLIKEYDICGGIITIGDNWVRKLVYDAIIKLVPDFNFVTSIHPNAQIGMNVQIGVGVVIMVGCIVNPNCIVEDFSFFGTGAQLDHDSKIEKFASISAGSITGGKVVISKYAFITLGAIIMDRITIGENVVVGSGSLVTKDLPPNVLAYGSPAKIVRTRELGEKFLKSN